MDWNSILQGALFTLAMTLISTALAYLFGLPLGIVLYATGKKGFRPNKMVNFVLGLIVNVLRSVPCLILVVLCMPWVRAWFGVATGKWYTMIIPLFVSTFAFVARLVEQSLNDVAFGKLEALRSMGASDLQLVTKGLLVETKPALISGVAVTAINVIGYTSFAYNIGAGGLISDIWSYYSRHTGNFQNSVEFWVMIVVVVLLVELFQEAGLSLSKILDKRKTAK